MPSNFRSVTILIHLNTLNFNSLKSKVFFFLALTLLIETLAVERKKVNRF